MNKKIISSLSLAVALSALLPFAVHAQTSIGALADTSGQWGYGSQNENASSSARAASTTDELRASATSSDARDENASSSNDRADGQFTAQEHQNVVASFVQSLRSVADREGGLGEQVRIIAREQQDSVATTTDAMEKVESRGFLKTLFIGSDYENLGILRSGIARTQNTLEQLRTILISTTDATARTVITAQIQALETDQANMQSFVTAHENSFSFFGWFTKLFIKTDTEN